MTKTGFNGYVYDFSVDCDAIAVDDILDIHKCLMKKNNMILKRLVLFKNFFYGINNFIERKFVSCNSTKMY